MVHRSKKMGEIMRSCEAWLKHLEKRARSRSEEDIFCREHLPKPIIAFEADNEPPPMPKVCEICGKPYPPNFSRVVIRFTDAIRTEAPQQEKG